MVIGSYIIPFSARLTLRTWWAWASIGMFLWMTPMPPWRAMAIASSASVTVSMAAETIGVLMGTLREKREATDTSRGRTSE